MFTFDYVFVVKGVLDLFAVLGAKNVDAFDLGELGETAGAGQSLEDGHIRLERESARLGDFAGHVDAAAVDFGDADRDLGIGDVFLEAIGDNAGELRWSESGSLHVIQERQGDAAVRPNGGNAGNLVFFP